jgi:hypothetical protein
MNEVLDRYVSECIPRLGARTQVDYMRHVEARQIHNAVATEHVWL